MSTSNTVLASAVFKPDVYALCSFIKDQFDQPTRGDSILVYADGQTRYVHRYDCVTYHILDSKTPRERCAINCLIFIDEESGLKGKCQLSYLIPDKDGVMNIPCFRDVIIQDQMVLSSGDMYELLMSDRVHNHLVKYGFA